MIEDKQEADSIVGKGGAIHTLLEIMEDDAVNMMNEYCIIFIYDVNKIKDEIIS